MRNNVDNCDQPVAGAGDGVGALPREWAAESSKLLYKVDKKCHHVISYCLLLFFKTYFSLFNLEWVQFQNLGGSVSKFGRHLNFFQFFSPPPAPLLRPQLWSAYEITPVSGLEGPRFKKKMTSGGELGAERVNTQVTPIYLNMHLEVIEINEERALPVPIMNCIWIQDMKA